MAVTTAETKGKRMFIAIVIIVIVASAGLLLAFGGYLFPPPTTNKDPSYSYSFTVEANTHDWVSWELTESLGIYGNFTSTGPTANKPVDFFICNEANYISFDESGIVSKLNEIYANVGAFKFVIPATGLWYWVLYNNGTEDITVDFVFAQDATAPTIETNLVPDEQYAGIYEVTATITDTFDIEMVEFLIDSDLITTQTGKNFAYTWVSSLWNNGFHNVTFTARDNVGNKRTIYFQIEILN